MIQLGYPPKRIDILTSATGVDFAQCYPNRTEITIISLDQPVPFIGLNDLLTNKTASAGPQDLADVDTLSQPQTSSQEGCTGPEQAQQPGAACHRSTMIARWPDDRSHSRRTVVGMTRTSKG